MKKILFILSALTVVLSSCLKSKPNSDFSNLSPVVELVESGKAYFSQDAITSSTDTITGTFTVNLASTNTLSTDVTVTVGVDTSKVAAYNAYDATISYTTLPSTAYVFPTQTVTIKAGSRLATLSYIIYKNKLSPSLSYMLPISILSTTQGIISGNFGTHYYHIIGNDFAGSYTHYYTRYNASDSITVAANPSNLIEKASETLSPVTAVQFEVHSYYYEGPRYEVTYTKTGSGTTALYSNFAVSLNSTDVTKSTADNATVIYGTPSMPLLPSTGSFTKAQVLQRLKFILPAASSGSARYTIDRYVHN